MKQMMIFMFTALCVTVTLIPMQKAMAQECMMGEVTMFAGNFAPRSYALAQGQLLSIAQNNALFSILGTTFGGDGRTNFALPDLRGRVPLGTGTGPGLTSRSLGQRGGIETVAMTTANLPAHNHAAALNANSGNSTTNNPGGASLAKPVKGSGIGTEAVNTYNATAPNVALKTGSVTTANTGSGSPVNVMQPYNALNYIICVQGIYPSRN